MSKNKKYATYEQYSNGYRILRTFENTMIDIVPKNEYNRAIISFDGVIVRGNMDIKIEENEKVIYETIPRKKFLKIIEDSMNSFGVFSIVIRTFHNNPNKNSKFPLKKLYGFVGKHGKLIRLPKQLNIECHCTSSLGEQLDPENDVEYM